MKRLLLILTCLPLALTAAEKPNVLLICVDDLKPVLGCYGDPHAKTPNLDRLASRSLRLDHAYCNQAVCAPSRHALMTSLRPQTLGIYGLATNFRKSRPNAVTLPQYFISNGYRAEGVGKIFHGNGEDEASWSVPHYQYQSPMHLRAENVAPPSSKIVGKGRKGTSTESADVADSAYADGEIALEAVKRIKAAKDKQEPFFLAVGFIKPHLPFTAPQKYWDMHDPATLPMPERNNAPEGAPRYARSGGAELRSYKDIPQKGNMVDAKLARRLIHGYYASTSYMDACVGVVLDALESNGLADNTIVVLWGDHGWHLGDHGMWCKHTNYEQATRIPLLISVPGKKSAVSKCLVESVDVYPTLAALAGLPVPQGLEGKSFVPVINDPTAPHRDHAIHVYPRGGLLGRAIRTDRYRLVEWKKIGADPKTAEFELYDYQSDPGETKNHAKDLPDVLSKLRERLATHPEARP